MSPYYKQGYDAGYAFTMKYFIKCRYTVDWPANWGQGLHGNGWAEGCIYARGVIYDRDYPGYKSITSLNDGSVQILFFDGKTEYV